MEQPRRPQVRETGIRCRGCGHDLSGTAIGGDCPECGLAASETLRLYGLKGVDVETSDHIPDEPWTLAGFLGAAL